MTTLYGGAQYQGGGGFDTPAPGTRDPNVMHNYMTTRAMQGHADGLSYLGGQAWALGGASAVNGMMQAISNPNAQMNAYMYGSPTGKVVDSGRGSYGGGGGGYYNQPYTDNSKHIQVAIPDLFKPSALPSAAPMSFGSMAPIQPGVAPRPVSPAAAVPIPAAAVAFGTAQAPMQASVPSVARQAAPPVNLIPMQARADQPLPPVSPTPEGLPAQRRPDMPPVAPRYAPLPMPPQYGNPYARPMPAPPPPMMAPQFNPGQYMPNLMPERTFYNPPPPPSNTFGGRLGRAFQRMGESLNPNIASANMARAKAQADVQMKAIEMDSQNWRNAADNTRAMMVEMMKEGGLDRRANFQQSNENYRSELQAQAQGRLTQSQGMEMLGKALSIAPQSQADLLQKQQMLMGASQALGQDFTGMIGQVSTEGANAALKQAMEFKKDAMAMLKTQNDLQMQPIENDIKRLQKQKAGLDVAMAPLDAMSKRVSMAKNAAELAAMNDPELQQAKRAEALAKSQDVQRRGAEDQFASIQKKAQMGSTMIAQANQVLANPLQQLSIPNEQKIQAQKLMQQGQQLQQVAYTDYLRTTVRPQVANQPLTDMSIVETYKQIVGGDTKKAREMAVADGWVLPQVAKPAPKQAIGMR